MVLSACDLALLGLYLAWFTRLLFGARTERRLHLVPSVSVPFGLFFLWSALSSLQAVNPLVSVYGLIPLLKAFLVFFYLANNVREERQLLGIGAALCLGILGQSVMAFTQYFSGTTFGLRVLGETRHSLLFHEMGSSELARVGGTLGHPNGLASFLVMALPIVLAIVVGTRRRWIGALGAVTLIAGLAVLVLTFSRGGWLGFALAAIAVVGLGAWKRWGFSRACLALVGFGLVAGLVTLPFADPISQRLFEEDYGKAWSRIPQMQVAWNMIQSHPVTGVGLDNYPFVMERYDNTIEHISLFVHNPVHNVYLLTMAEVGIPGLGFLLVVIGVLIRRGWRGFQQGTGLSSFFALGLLGGLAGYLVHGLVNFNFLGSRYFFAFLMGLLAASAFWRDTPVIAAQPLGGRTGTRRVGAPIRGKSE